MIILSLREIVLVTHGRVVNQGTLCSDINFIIKEIAIDSRNTTQGCLFIALKGKRFDAHEFAFQAVNNGAVALLVSKQLNISIPQILVTDTRIALGQLASLVRQKVKTRVIALTGSSGKTSVKEMTASILRQSGETLCTFGNMNNEIGVPLTLLRLTNLHRYAVIELGANRHGEIAWTSTLTRPESVLINNLAISHLDGFGSLSGISKAKSEIFLGLLKNGTAVINLDSNDLLHWRLQLTQNRIWSFSNTANVLADFYATNIILNSQNSSFTLHTPYGVSSIILPLPGRHNISNALAASALALSVGATLKEVTRGLATIRSIPGRLFPIILGGQKLLLDDTYNSNSGSMIAAAQTLSEMPGYRMMVIGDMAELGRDSVKHHLRIGRYIRKIRIDKILSIGTLSKYISKESYSGEHFGNSISLIARIESFLTEHQAITIIVKGSRNSKMEQIVKILQEKVVC